MSDPNKFFRDVEKKYDMVARVDSVVANKWLLSTIFAHEFSRWQPDSDDIGIVIGLLFPHLKKYLPGFCFSSLWEMDDERDRKS